MKLRAKFRFCSFFSVFELSRKKCLKLGLFATKIGTPSYLVYFIVWKWLESKKIVICLNLRANLRFLGFFYAFWALYRKKWLKLGSFAMKLGTQTILYKMLLF